MAQCTEVKIEGSPAEASGYRDISLVRTKNKLGPGAGQDPQLGERVLACISLAPGLLRPEPAFVAVLGLAAVAVLPARWLLALSVPPGVPNLRTRH